MKGDKYQKGKGEKMKKFLLIIMILLSVNLFAETKTFIREYTYNASEYDSKVTSRANALAQVKELLLSKLEFLFVHKIKSAQRK